MTMPFEITQDCDNSSLQFASFGFYEGRYLVKQNNLKQVTSYSKLIENENFLVCCGDVVIKVKSTDYPEIERRVI